MQYFNTGKEPSVWNSLAQLSSATVLFDPFAKTLRLLKITVCVVYHPLALKGALNVLGHCDNLRPWA